MIEFGRIFIAVFGYGLALLFVVGVGAALRDAHRATKSPDGKAPDGTTQKENIEIFFGMVFLVVASVLATMFILWLTS